MDQATFIAKYGPIKIARTAERYFGRLRQPHFAAGKWETIDRHGPPILGGHFSTIGYFPPGQDPTAMEHDWAALDAALTLAARLVAILKAGDCYALQSEGDGPFFPFVFSAPPHAGAPTPAALGASLPPELEQAYASRAIRASYSSSVEVIALDDRACVFWDDDMDEDYAADLEPASYAAYREASALMQSSLSELVEMRLYSDFVDFPQIYGGRDQHGTFVGVITSLVWT
jgi:hypothetical protein